MLRSSGSAPDEQQPRPPVSGAARTVAISANRAAYWISRHWLLLFNLAVALFVGLPFLAPVLMHQGAEGPARIIYRIFSPVCHQMAHRSWFLFGDESYYPLRATGLPDVTYFEQSVQDDPAFAGLDPVANFGRYNSQGRRFLGNERMGYKVALCQRDVAIYLALLLGGLIFGLLRSRLGPLRWQLFVLFGMLPMVLDGGYQLVTYVLAVIAGDESRTMLLYDIASRLSMLFSVHETTPFLRTLTGALFGFGLAWMTYPHIQQGMEETKVDLRENLVRGKVI
jgi:uncharacterized membrane protein